MFQTFENPASPEKGPARLAALRTQLKSQGLDGFLVPRADAHQGEYVADCDARLAWLSGFTGSAGFAIVLPHIAGVFIDGRYRTQVKAQVDLAHFTPVPWPETGAAEWLIENFATGGVIGFDPWLHTPDELAKLEKALAGQNIRLKPTTNQIDVIWSDRPAPPKAAAFAQNEAVAGESSASKRARLGTALVKAGEKAAVITLSDSICWLLNIRGRDVPRNPVIQGFAVLHSDGALDLFADLDKFAPPFPGFGEEPISLHAPEAFLPYLSRLKGPVRIDNMSAPLAVMMALETAEIAVSFGQDPCILPKARKNAAELRATRHAHLRDGAAVCEFLAWLSAQTPENLTEIAVVKALEGFRAATNQLFDISFDTICGSGPNGAIIHYRVSEDSDRSLSSHELLLVDSGAQYEDGTTDITRTIAMGAPSAEEVACYTAVLRGLIAISRARFPRGLAGRDLDALARQHLWSMGLDYNHGTGHGVGVFLSVHEGPQRLSRVSEVMLEPGMMLSNEPGYYREGAFGIRLENLIVVEKAADLGDNRDQLGFETLTFVPFDRKLIAIESLSLDERAWLNAYHAEVLAKIRPSLSSAAKAWAEAACAPI